MPLRAIVRARPHVHRARVNILFIGGTGIISTACVELALARGFRVTVLNRGRRSTAPRGAETLFADLADPAAVEATLRGRTWDSVVDFVAFTPEDIRPRLELFRGRIGQYIFISSASAYQKPLSHYLITESTPLVNPFWDYSRQKIAGEELLMEAYRQENYPVTIVRPSLTYGGTQVPLILNSWEKSFTAVARLRRGAPVIVPGDGLSLWTITHNTDFAKGLVGLLGHPGALGHAFHITSDEVLTWNQLYEQVAAAAGAPPPRLVHIASDFITTCLPDTLGTLIGDKSNSAVFDNSKIKRFVPDFVATTSFRRGIQRTIEWFDADPARQQIDRATDARWDRLIAAYERGLAAARAEFATSSA